MITDSELYQKAKGVLNPRKLSSSADAGGVASALVTVTGNIYTGVCIDTSSSMGFCAEHNAIGSMITSGESRITTIVAVNWDGQILPPCGRCREFIYQMHSDNSSTRVLLKDDQVSTIADLLPHHWTQTT